jgi:5-methyltetrahydrofolate--homocysteine methyltransferase
MAIKFLDKLKKDFIVLDGGMGTQLQAMGMELGGIPELLNLTNPEMITKIHSGYVAAGADLVYANTFGANRKKMARTGKSVDELIKAAIVNAKKSGASYVALDIGPIGALLEPLGDLSFEEAYDIFKEQVIAGSKADVIVIETMTDLYEAKAAVLAAKENSDKPVIVTMSFESSGRTFTGTDAVSMATTLEGLGVDAIGLNCSLGPAALAPIIKTLSESTTLPLVFKPNAGLPDPLTGKYDVLPDEFAAAISEVLPLGVKMVGGCCGSTPDYIMKVAIAVDNFRKQIAENGLAKMMVERKEPEVAVCSSRKAVVLDMPRVIGERINPTGKKRFQEALKKGDMDYVLNQAIQQVEAGADILDVNVGVPGIDEKETMVKVIKAIQSVVDVPLQIDSSNPSVIEAALRIYNGKPIVNSVNGDESSIKSVLPLVAKYGASVVGLTLDKTGIQKTAQARYYIAERIYRSAIEAGIKPKNVFIDCLTMTASTEQDAVMATLEAMQRVRHELGLKTVLGVSNISFGLPFREQVTTTFLTMALCYGLTLPIINPNIEPIMGAVRSFRLLGNYDKNSTEYIEAYGEYVPELKRAKDEVAKLRSLASGDLADVTEESSGNASKEGNVWEGRAKAAFGKEGEALFRAVVKGLKDEGVVLTSDCLKKGEALEIVNEVLIPALDFIGSKFEKGTLFLPQLILSASVVQASSETIKTHLAKSGSEQVDQGKVVLATVKGDIHDIGKNLVKVLLENYGFTVIDLGKDVPPEKVVEAARKEDVRLVGLSALMTTTLVSMKETVEQLKEAGLNCKTVVGGAVLTPEYAQEIGADYYAKDALETCNIAREVYSE